MKSRKALLYYIKVMLKERPGAQFNNIFTRKLIDFYSQVCYNISRKKRKENNKMNITPEIWAMMDDFEQVSLFWEYQASFDDFEEALAIKFEDFDRMMRGEA